MKKYKSIFVSDFHLGSKGCQAELLSDFLKKHSCDNLFLVGDITDGWKLRQKIYWPETHSRVIRHIIDKQKNGTKLFYIPGNHDEFVRDWLDINIAEESITLTNEYYYEAVNGKRYLVTHGDMFDGVNRMAKWLSYLGDTAYSFLLWSNQYVNAVRRKFGFQYWSLSSYLKHNVKKAVNFIFDFENNVVRYCRSKDCDGIICGHIHSPAMKVIYDIEYMNTGDFVESCTALVETYDGRWELIYWR